MNMNELKSPPESSIPKTNQRSRQQVQQELQQKEERLPKYERLRLVPIWLRILLVTLFFVAAAAIGLIIGYSAIGDGDAGDALKWDTWQHLLDIIEGKE